MPASTLLATQATTRTQAIGIIAAMVYALCIVAANVLLRTVGLPLPNGDHLLPVGGGLLAPSGTFAAALTLVARDVVQRTLGRQTSLAIALPAAAITAALSWQLAYASTFAFLWGERCDHAVYTPLARRRLLLAVFASVLTGSLVDSVIFIILAGIPLHQPCQASCWANSTMSPCSRYPPCRCCAAWRLPQQRAKILTAEELLTAEETAVIYLSGAVRSEIVGSSTIGIMLTPDMGNRVNLRTTAWGADTGCFSQHHDFRLDRYLAWLVTKQQWRDRCLFATAPDVARRADGQLGGDARATLDRSKYVLPVIRALGYPAALVAQNGLEDLRVPWDTFDVLFLGGDDTWKLGPAARALVTAAKQRGKWAHMGRVNSEKRLRYAHAIGCDSADGTFIAYRPDEYVLRVRRWLRRLPDHTTSLWTSSL